MEQLIRPFTDCGWREFHLQLRRKSYCKCKFVFSFLTMDWVGQFYHQLTWSRPQLQLTQSSYKVCAWYRTLGIHQRITKVTCRSDGNFRSSLRVEMLSVLSSKRPWTSWSSMCVSVRLFRAICRNGWPWRRAKTYHCHRACFLQGNLQACFRTFMISYGWGQTARHKWVC